MANDLVTDKSRLAFAHLNGIASCARGLYEAPPERIRRCLPRLLRVLSLMNRLAERTISDWRMITVRRGQTATDAGYAYRACFGIQQIATELVDLPPAHVEGIEARLSLVGVLLNAVYFQCWPSHRGHDDEMTGWYGA